jgi:hypothetical protein
MSDEKKSITAILTLSGSEETIQNVISYLASIPVTSWERLDWSIGTQKQKSEGLNTTPLMANCLHDLPAICPDCGHSLIATVVMDSGLVELPSAVRLRSLGESECQTLR